GKALDANFIHNQAYRRALLAGNDSYLRNEGVGTWEINLAAFLADLNTNQWNRDGGVSGNYYQYNQANTPPLANRGIAFDDAMSFLSYRYAGNYRNLRSVSRLYGSAGI